MSDLYKYAAKNKLRFPSDRGELTAEQLFQLPLTGLDNTARTIHQRLKAITQESFVQTTTVTPEQKQLENALEIVKDVIATKQAENAAEYAKRQKAVERRKILDAISAKRDQALTTASLDELEKKLAALED